LPTGTDGVYSAVANGTNLTGLFSFSIRGGLQTEGSRGNSWVFFVDGQTLRGTTSANAANGKVVGILDSGLSTGITGGEDGNVTLPAIIYIPGNSGSGSFQGKMDMNSPTGYFDGKGEISGLPARTDQLITVSGNLTVTVTVTPISIPASDQENVDFKFRGSRLSTTTNPTSPDTTTTTAN
jgi:hypothetical protein